MLFCMHPYMLILMAERSYVGAESYQYSIRISRANGSGRWLAQRIVFADEIVFRRRINAVLPIGVDANNILSKLQREGIYWIAGDVKMTDRQAARFGWAS
jgi:hypothetical protein